MAERRDWRSVDIVQEAYRLSSQHCMTKAAQEFLWRSRQVLSPDAWRPESSVVESPAEAVFLLWFLAEHGDGLFKLDTQVEVQAAERTYRFDFTVRTVFGAIPGWKDLSSVRLPVAVEIDGHSFHEKTLEQVTHRNRRDRELQMAGYRVLHYSFSELMRSPLDCVNEVYAAAQSALVAYDNGLEITP